MKSLKPFTFDKIVYPDRYLHQNRQKMKLVEKSANDLLSQKKELEKELEGLQTFIGTFSVNHTLQQVGTLLEKVPDQQRSGNIDGELNQVSLHAAIETIKAVE